MRISDWSSDVCSSDLYMAANLRELALPGGDAREVLAVVGAGHLSGLARHLREDDVAPAIVRADLEALEEKSSFPWFTMLLAVFVLGGFAWGFWQGGIDVAAALMLRSEEHTSALQSLLRT